ERQEEASTPCTCSRSRRQHHEPVRRSSPRSRPLLAQAPISERPSLARAPRPHPAAGINEETPPLGGLRLGDYSSVDSSTWSRNLRISDARKRRWPPRVRIAEILPARAQRVTVLGLTRNIAATSEGVSNCSGSGASFCAIWTPGLGEQSRMCRLAASVREEQSPPS